MTRQASPQARIRAGDPWYVDSQFQVQLRTAGRRRVIEDRWRLFASMIESWQRAHRVQRAFRVLDAGCGDGINLVGLQTMATERQWPMRLVAADYNPLRVGRVRERMPEVAVQQGSLYALPYAASSFDIVLCSHVLEHVPDLHRALGECRRVLEPGGLFIVAVPNEGCALARLRNYILQREIGRTTDHVHFFTERTLARELRAAGFQLTRLERETFFFPISYVNMLCTEFSAGHALMVLLRRLLPSQAGGLIVAAS